MQRWKITIEYDGSSFYGWQVQAEDITIQQVIEDAIYKLSGERLRLHVAGRTDAGVHAKAQVAHFDLKCERTEEEVFGALNHYLKRKKIAILRAEKVSQEFHARFNAISRSYRYLIINRRAPLSLNAGKAWHIPSALNIEPMQEAAKILIGKHDFSTFRAQNCQAKSPIKTMDVFEIEQAADLISFKIKSRSFLYHQVRNMVGTLSLVGQGKWDLATFEEAFAAKDRAQGGTTAPPEGLYFWQVEYPENN